MPPKPVHASRITLAQVMQPAHANPLGNVHGGLIMKLMDEAAASAATRHAQRPCVTVAVDQVIFREPIRIGDLVTLNAELTYVGRTSIEVRVEVVAQNLVTGRHTHTNTAYFVFVALDPSGHPAAVPPLAVETENERRQWEAAKERQAYRLAQRKKENDVSS